MKQRLLSSALGLVLLFVVVVFFDTLLLNLAVSAVATLGVYELLDAAKLKMRSLMLPSLTLTAFVPFVSIASLKPWLPYLCYLFAILLFLVLLFRHPIRVEQIGLSFLMAVAISLSFSNLVFMRDEYETPLALMYLVVALGSAWFSDASAYFVGRAIGKRPLAPTISPKKTVEGAIGGVIGCVICNLLAAFALSSLLNSPEVNVYFGGSVQVYYLRLLLVSPVLSLLSMFGDLCASAVKRQFGVKDFGSIMPGHGGVMDRFDSVCFVLPFVYILSILFPLGA